MISICKTQYGGLCCHAFEKCILNVIAIWCNSFCTQFRHVLHVCQSTTQTRPHDHKLRIFLSQNFKLVLISFAVVLLMKRNFKDLFKSTFCSHLQIYKTVCPIKLEISKSNFRLKYFFSLWSWGQSTRGAFLSSV